MMARAWSNNELRKFAHKFKGDVVNVSAWADRDKEGGTYKSYFKNAKTYTLMNNKGKKGFQNTQGEIFLDLEEDIPKTLVRKFDVVFNHTTLNWIYDFKKAFRNLCLMSRKTVILIVPFSVEDNKSYWRFTPKAMKRMFKDNGFEVDYLTMNYNPFAYRYIFAVGERRG